jgi:hypothetical protein
MNERLAILKKIARQIGIDRSSAYELLKLHPNRQRVLEQCRKANHWPGWDAHESQATEVPVRGVATDWECCQRRICTGPKK